MSATLSCASSAPKAQLNQLHASTPTCRSREHDTRRSLGRWSVPARGSRHSRRPWGAVLRDHSCSTRSVPPPDVLVSWPLSSPPGASRPAAQSGGGRMQRVQTSSRQRQPTQAWSSFSLESRPTRGRAGRRTAQPTVRCGSTAYSCTCEDTVPPPSPGSIDRVGPYGFTSQSSR